MNTSNFTAWPEFELRLRPIPLSLYIVAHSILAFLIVIGNSVVIAVFFKDRANLTPNIIFLGSLAVVDFLTGLFAIPLVIFARVVISSVTCLAGSRISFFSPALVLCAVSVGHLIDLAIDRYIAVSHPVKYAFFMTRRRSKYILMTTWIVTVSFGLLPAVGAWMYPDQWVCGTVNYKSGAVTTHSIIGAGFGPTFMAMLLAVYARIYWIANRHLKGASVQRRAGMDASRVRSLESKSRMRATVTVVLLVVVFGVCWLPMCAKTALDVFWDPPEHVQFLYQTVAEFLVLGNSVANPIIYSMRSNKYRKPYRAFLRLLCPFVENTPELKRGGVAGDTKPTSRGSSNVSNPTLSTGTISVQSHSD